MLWHRVIVPFDSMSIGYKLNKTSKNAKNAWSRWTKGKVRFEGGGKKDENKIKNRIRLSTVYSSSSLFISLHLARYFPFYNEKLCKTKTEKQQKVYLIANDN